MTSNRKYRPGDVVDFKIIFAVRAIKAYTGSRDTVPLILNLDTR